MAEGKIKDPDPPRALGAIVGNNNALIALGTLYEIIDGKQQEPVIYINNLGWKFCSDDRVGFEWQVVDPNLKTGGRIAINVFPLTEKCDSKS